MSGGDGRFRVRWWGWRSYRLNRFFLKLMLKMETSKLHDYIKP